MNSYHGNKI